MDRIDIYGYEKIMAELYARIARTPIPEENRELLRGFDRMCVLEGLSIGRRIKLLVHLLRFSRDLGSQPLATISKAQLQDAIAQVEARQDLAKHTKHDIKITIRKFFKWVILRDQALVRDEWPDLVAWIKPTLSKRDRCRVRAADLLTPDEVEKLIEVTRNPRNRAFLAMLYEIGGRIGELGNLRIGDVTRDEFSLLVDLDGKTGRRTVRIVLYAVHVVTWMNLHPARNDPAAPMWPSLRPERYLRPLPYRELVSWVKQAQEHAGVKRRLYPHLFRHSRATHLLAAGKLNEAQAKVFFGWVPDSSILATYAHLVTQDANDAILRMYGIKKVDAVQAQGLACGMCGATNPRTTALCFHCGYALDLKAPDEIRRRTQAAEESLLRFLQVPDVQALFKKWSAEENSGDKSISRHVQELQSPEPTSAIGSRRSKR